MGIFKAVGGALNQLSEFLTTAERNKQIKEGVANGELMEVHQASFIIQVKEMLISDSLTCTRCNGLCIPVLGRVEHSQIVSVSAMVEGSTRPSD